MPFSAQTDTDGWERAAPAQYLGLLPWTHQTYRLLQRNDLKWLKTQDGFITCAIIDVLVAIIPVVLILFIQIPRRKEPE